MAISNQTNRTSATGAGAILVIPYSFPTTASGDLIVIRRLISTGVESDPLIETTDYTATYSESGGTVTTVATVAATYQIHVIRNTPMTQNLDLVAGGAFNAENIEDAFDKVTKLAIENSDSIDRCLRFPLSDPDSVITEIPDVDSRKGKYLMFDSTTGAASVTNSVVSSTAAVSAFGATLIDDTTASAALTTLGVSTFAKTVIDDTTALAAMNTLKGMPVINVLYDGTVKADSSTDDSAAIQAIIDAAGASSIIYFPAGSYNIETALTVDDANVVFRGAGNTATTILQQSCNGLTVTADNFTCEDMCFHLEDNGQDFYGIKIDGDDAATRRKYAVIRNCRFKGHSVMVNFNWCFHPIITGCSTSQIEGECPLIGILVDGTTYNARIVNNSICINDNTTATSKGIHLTSEGGGGPEGTIIIGNEIYNAYWGIHVSYSLMTIIIGNELAACGCWAIDVAVGYCMIIGNCCALSETAAIAGASCIRVGDATVTMYQTRSVISDNLIWGNDKTDCIGINVGNYRQNFTITGNYVWNCRNYGICIKSTVNADNSSNCNISGNFIEDVDASASIFLQSSGNLVSNNILMDDLVVYDEYSVGNVIQNNFFNGTSKILYDSGTTTIIKDNTGCDETKTTGTVTLQHWGTTSLDSSGGAITGTLPDGTFIGQIKTIVMTVYGTSSTVSITHHQTSDPEVATFDAVDETGVFMWTGTEWITLFATCTFV